jgi:hypothetical protein
LLRFKGKHYFFIVILLPGLFFTCLLSQQRVIVDAFVLKFGIHLLEFFADLLLIVQHIKLVVAVDTKKQLIFYILAKGLQTNLVLDSKADHHHNIVFGQLWLEMYSFDANPLVAIIAERKHFLSHQPPSMH